MMNLSFYAQDTWRVSSRLNLTYGLRWDFNSVPHSLDPNNGNLVPLLGGYATGNVTVGVPGTPLWRPSYTNFAPRLGAAWRLRRQPGRETVVRAGGGLFYDTGIAEASAEPWVIGYPAGQATVVLNSSLPVNPAEIRLPPVNCGSRLPVLSSLCFRPTFRLLA